MKTFKMLLIFSVVSAIPLILTGCAPPPPLGKGYLEIDSFPQGANVFINDKSVGQTPHKVQFSWVGPVSFHSGANIIPRIRIVLIKEGYFREERTLRNYKDVIIEQEGDRRPGHGKPAKARVMFYLTPSSPVSTVEKPSTPTTTPPPQQQQQMMGPTIVIGGKTVTGEEAVKIVNYGTVKFDSTPPRAEVLIEGNLVGFTPTAFLKFQAGTYNVKIIKVGYKPWERKIMVIQDSTITINPQLEKESAE